jgi:hypothetical protein
MFRGLSKPKNKTQALKTGKNTFAEAKRPDFPPKPI